MSVLACDRRRCPEIMCNRMILGNRYYICEDCWNELLIAKKTWSAPMALTAVAEHIEAFMKTAPGTHLEPVGQGEIDDEFERLTGDGS